MRRSAAILALLATMSGCGGGNDSGFVAPVTGPAPAPTPSPSPTPTPVASTSANCTLRAREDWVLAEMKEWWLFPDQLADADPNAFTNVSDYLDALTANARAKGEDRYFTYLTSISTENAYYSSGASAGLGVRLGYDGSSRVFVIEAFEGAPALAAGIDRGTEILGVGTTTSNVQSVSSIIASQGIDGVSSALGDSTAGTVRVLQVRDASGTRTVSVTYADYDIAPVSSRYGAQVITDGGQKFGYVNLRTFITPAEQTLTDAFQTFKTAGVNNVIVDLRYNGGGLLSTAQVLANLLGGGRSTSDVIDKLTYRPEKSSYNETDYFAPVAQSVAPTRVAFIGSGGTASASELVINAFTPYLHANSGLIGTNTYGKPVGQIALDNTDCNDRLRVIAFALQNSAGNANYYNGLAGTVEASCQAYDDISYPLGDSRESSTRAALDFLEGKSCTPISAGATTQALSANRRNLLSPRRPSTAQREVPGLF